MTKKELEQLRALYLEINTLAGDIFSLQPKIVVDSVTGCTPERTQKHVIPIKGVDMEEYIRLEKKAAEKTKILVERIGDKVGQADKPLDGFISLASIFRNSFNGQLRLLDNLSRSQI